MPARIAILAALLAAFVLAACSSTVTETETNVLATESIAQPGPPSGPTVETTVQGDPNKTIESVLKASGDLSTMSRLVDAARMDVALGGTGPNTLFAPTNAAFEKLPEGMLATLEEPANAEKLRELLRYHLVMGNVPSEQMVTIERVMTYQGGILNVTSQGSTLTIDGAVRIIQPDVAASNGLIDVIDTVLVPKDFRR